MPDAGDTFKFRHGRSLIMTAGPKKAGGLMKAKFTLGTIAATVRSLIKQAEVATVEDPELCEVAGMVYVGDVYSLREDMKSCGHDDGWGKRCYVCKSGEPVL